MSRQATLTGLVAYAQKGKANALASQGTLQLAVYNCRAWNRSGGTINVGLLRKLDAGQVRLYTKVASTYTEYTVAQVEAGLAVVNTTNNDGFVVAANRRFGLFGITVSNTATGGTYAFKYWNGSTYTTLTTLENPTTLGSAQDEYVVFLPPNDWVAGGPTGVDTDAYSILVQHTTAPGDTGSINALWLGEFLDFYEGVGDNNAVQLLFPSEKPFILEAGEGLFPYFSTANAANVFAAFYSTQ